MSTVTNLVVYTTIVSVFGTVLRNDHRIPFIETQFYQTWWPLSIPIGMVYVAIVLRWPHKLSGLVSLKNVKTALQYWNFTLAVFSVLGAYRTAGELVSTLHRRGFVASFCVNDYFHDRSIYFWYSLFILSKLAEFGDTMFLLVQRKPVLFIHWFHHVVTMVYSVYIAAYLPAIGRWMSAMNFVVHSFMYIYYWAVSCQVPVPRRVAICITTMQTSQMFTGFTIIMLALYHKMYSSSVCQNGGYTVEAGAVMYLVYIYLFVKLFIKYFKMLASSSKKKVS